MLHDLLSSYSAFGFSGSRHISEETEAAIKKAVYALPALAAPSVGCASGADKVVRQLRPNYKLFSVSSERYGTGKSAYARRSIDCVNSIAPGGLWLFFPSSPCPSGLYPSASSSKCFSGHGSGTWASAAYAAGSGCSLLAYLPLELPAPQWQWQWLDLNWVYMPAPGKQQSLF